MAKLPNNYFVPFIFLLTCTLQAPLSSCRASGVLAPPPGDATDSNRLTDVAVALPDKAGLKEENRELLNGYQLLIEPLVDGCLTAKPVIQVHPWASTTIKEQFVQGCDYSVGMRLGKLSGDSSSLAAVYYTNWVSSKNALILKKESFQGRDTIALPLALKLTPEGEAAGFGKQGDTTTTPVPPGMTDLVISVDIGANHPIVATPTPQLPPVGETPGSAVEFIEVKATKTGDNPRYSPVLNDIVNHETPEDSNSYDDFITLDHETCHGIHAHIRNNLNTLGRKANGFYVLNGKGVLVAEPKMRKSQVAPFVPASLRGSKYNLYISGQTAWDDTPLYIFDEWNAYVNGSATGVDMVKAGKWTQGQRDAVYGTVEFAPYAIAVAMAVRTHDPSYFSSNKQFKEFLAWNLRRGMDLYREGVKITQFQMASQDAFYEKFKTSPDAEDLRKFAREYFGTAWTQQVLGF